MNDFLMSVAPTVASALLGPLGGIAVAGLGKILGLDSATQTDITKAITNSKITSEQLAEIQKMELQYQNDEKERGFKYVELEFKDVDSARQMQMATKSSTPTILSYGVLILGSAMMASVLFGWAKVDSVLAGTLIGYATSEMKSVLQYWFGTSDSSRSKSEMLLNSTPNK